MNRQATNIIYEMPGLERHDFQDDVKYLAFGRGLDLLGLRYGDCVAVSDNCFKIKRAGIDFTMDSWIVSVLVRALPSCWEHSVENGEDMFRLKSDKD